MSTDTALIEIEGLRIRAFHGVFPQERLVGNTFEISVSLAYPPALRAVASDDIADTLNYAEIIDLIKEVMRQPSDLLENVAGRIRDAILGRYSGITSGRISVAKLAPPLAAEIDCVRFVLLF